MRTSWLLVSCLGLGIVGQSCQGGIPVIQPGEASDGGITTDSGRAPIEDVVTIDSGCATSNSRGKLRPSNLLFVINRSGSMACNLPEDGQSTENCSAFPTRLFPNLPSKWELTKSAVLQAVSELRDAGTVRLGLSVFPKAGSQCTVTTEPDVELALLDAAHQTKITEVLDRVEPAGETPLAGATILGYAHLLEEMRTTELDGETFVVVVTDGYETCKPDELPKLTTQDVPNALRQLGIRTFVIGAPGSDDGRYLLSQIAIAGGTRISADCKLGSAPNEGNCHYDMTESADFARDLLAALLKVNAEVLACTLENPFCAERRRSESRGGQRAREWRESTNEQRRGLRQGERVALLIGFYVYSALRRHL
ncbi:MAG: VWA domain-containing protein [Polyangiaceae bacterium]